MSESLLNRANMIKECEKQIKTLQAEVRRLVQEERKIGTDRDTEEFRNDVRFFFHFFHFFVAWYTHYDKLSLSKYKNNTTHTNTNTKHTPTHTM